MSVASRLMVWGMLLVMVAVAAYIAVDWAGLLARHPHYLRPLRAVVKPTLQLSWYWAFIVPLLLLVASVVRFFTAKSGRAMIVWKLFAYVTLWAIGSFSFFFGLFLVYAPGLGEGGRDLLLPALAACFGYILLGLGFLASVLQRD